MPGGANPHEPLRLEEIEPRPKRFHLSRLFVDYVGISKQDAVFGRDLVTLRRCVLAGTPVPPTFYRQDKGIDTDDALVRFGIMHLHLGGQHSNVLVYLFQFAEDVCLLEINTHRPFESRPPGILVNQRHRAAVLVAIAEAFRVAEDAARQSGEALKSKNADIRARLGLGKRDDRR